MSDRVKKSTRRPKKRKGFRGTKPVDIVPTTTVERPVADITSQSIGGEQQQHQQQLFHDNTLPSTSTTTISSKKVHSINSPSINEGEAVSGYRFIDLEILNNVIQLLCCPTCHGTLELYENGEKKKGLASLL